MKKILKTFRLPIIFAVLALTCGIAFNVIGSHVDEQGILREPFMFIPLFWLFIALMLVSSLIIVLKILTNKR